MDKYIKKANDTINIDINDNSDNNSSSNQLTDKLNEINTKIFGNTSFRPYQLEIIESILNNDDVFVIMPTGGGKSLCYALPAILSIGVTIVISPLISLIEDQVSSFIQLTNNDTELIGIPCAYLTSTCTASMTKAVIQDLSRIKSGLEPYLKLLYLTPERIVKSEITLNLLKVLYNNTNLARFVIDEAHCVSSWGHDFRKDYGLLGLLKLNFPQTPIVALTATARTSVAIDVIKMLNIPNCKRFNAGFDRDNLYFEVREKPSKKVNTLQSILQYIKSNHTMDSTGIIYCMTKLECEETSDYLRDNGISSDYYHAGQSKNDRKLVQGNWLSGAIKVVCATIAYGMGIDKRDVRYVIHLSLAKSLEGYYQEAGRAGRDGQLSHCIIYYKSSDVNALARIMIKYPARNLSKRDRERLEEMKEYCENKNDCRRKLFHDKFYTKLSNSSSTNSLFQPCLTMCDVCLLKSGNKLKSNRANNNISSSTEPTQPLAKFQKASELINNRNNNTSSNNWLSNKRPIDLSNDNNKKKKN